ncbi:MAG: hypothetical protein QG655_3856 [Actinomycetota bacterium]|nr:hypothetical protein [Actinomycetota bacterium]
MRIHMILAIVIPLAVMPLGVAHADSNDDDFLQRVANVGIAGPAADLINNARLVCEALDNGTAPKVIADAIASQLGFRPDRAVSFSALSVTHYCPQYGNMPFNP